MASRETPVPVERSLTIPTLVARIALGLALAVVTWLCLTPDISDPGLVPWDKARHFLAFYMLTGLAVVGLPRVGLQWIVLAMLAYGALIEILQGFAGRDRSLADFLADAAGIAAVLVAMAAQQMRSAAR